MNPKTSKIKNDFDIRLTLVIYSYNTMPFKDLAHKQQYALEYNKEWKANNPDKVREQQQRYREKYRDEIKAREYGKKWKQENEDKVLESSAKYRDSHREKLREYAKEYREKNKEKIMQSWAKN